MRLRLCLPRYKSSQKCVTSKAVLHILIWCFSVSLVFHSFIEAAAYSTKFLWENKEFYYLCMCAANAVVLCFYPLAGFLADNRIGRFITIYEATKFLLLLIILKGIIYSANFVTAVFAEDVRISYQFSNIILAISTLILLLTAVTLALFNANIIQFGVDQLQDSPADHQSLYIYWYVWINYVVVFILLTASTITSV